MRDSYHRNGLLVSIFGFYGSLVGAIGATVATLPAVVPWLLIVAGIFLGIRLGLTPPKFALVDLLSDAGFFLLVMSLGLAAPLVAIPAVICLGAGAVVQFIDLKKSEK